jgi:hypothetical protein
VDNGSNDPDGDAITLSQSPAGPYGLGDTLVTLTVTDNNGATDSCMATVTVTDEVQPTIDVSVSPDTLWPPNHKMREINANVTASDACDADPSIVLMSVVSNEPDNGKGDGNTINDIQGADIGIDDRSLMLRAERSGGGDGRIYTITYNAIDASGNMATGSAIVTVPHNK